MAKVFAVSRCNEGWNSVVAVFIDVKWETIERRFPTPHYVIDEIELEKNLTEWPKEDNDV